MFDKLKKSVKGLSPAIKIEAIGDLVSFVAALVATYKVWSSAVKYILNIEFKLWQILLLCLIILVINLIFCRYKRKPKYTKDNINGINWEWDWVKKNHKWSIPDLQIMCPEDNTPLIRESKSGTSTYNCRCPRCDYQTSYSVSDYQDAHLIILDNAKKDNPKSRINNDNEIKIQRNKRRSSFWD
ncbi:MAG: hypothetical protein LBQ74_09745 [Prevotella sp.]|jgi:hypothetical protein|nr:hypothetical protein [Prevotella sp.]